jgi:hypothetical protein
LWAAPWGDDGGNQQRRRRDRAEDGEPVAVARVEGTLADIGEAGARGGLHEERQGAAQAAGGIDGAGDAVIGRTQDPGAFSAARIRTISTCCKARGALAEIAVVGSVVPAKGNPSFGPMGRACPLFGASLRVECGAYGLLVPAAVMLNPGVLTTMSICWPSFVKTKK